MCEHAQAEVCYALDVEAFGQLESVVGAVPSIKLSTNLARCCG